MRRDITIYISCLLIIMIVTSFVSCGNQYTNDSANVLEQKIEIQEYGYAGIEIPINVIFEKEISSVDFGFKTIKSQA